jgi:hypothetical protein
LGVEVPLVLRKSLYQGAAFADVGSPPKCQISLDEVLPLLTVEF